MTRDQLRLQELCASRALMPDEITEAKRLAKQQGVILRWRRLRLDLYGRPDAWETVEEAKC